MISAFKRAFHTLSSTCVIFAGSVCQEVVALVIHWLSFNCPNNIPVNHSLLCLTHCGEKEPRCFKAVTALPFALFPGSYEDESLNDQLEWKNGQGQAFAQGGFRLVNNQIVIPQTGLYFVYSQASFRVSCSDGDEEGAAKRLTPLSHRIWRYSDSIGNRASLMSAVRSACQNTAQEDSYRVGQGWYNAIYLGAVFQLNKGDKLWTETNQPSELETDEGKTFFGVFALWNDSLLWYKLRRYNALHSAISFRFLLNVMYVLFYFYYYSSSWWCRNV